MAAFWLRDALRRAWRRRDAPAGAHPPTPTARPGAPGAVFVARGLSKTYHVGEVDVVALRAVDLEIRAGCVACTRSYMRGSSTSSSRS